MDLTFKSFNSPKIITMKETTAAELLAINNGNKDGLVSNTTTRAEEKSKSIIYTYGMKYFICLFQLLSIVCSIELQEETTSCGCSDKLNRVLDDSQSRDISEITSICVQDETMVFVEGGSLFVGSGENLIPMVSIKILLIH